VTLTSQNIDKHQKNKKNKPLDAPNIGRHQKKQKKQKFQQLLRSGPIVPGNFSFFVFFGACAGLVHLVVWFFCFFWCLCRFGTSSGLFVFLMPVQVLVILDCVCLDLGHILNLCFKKKQTYRYL